MQNGTYQTVQTDRIQTGVALVDKKAGAMLEMNWYMTQMDLIGQGKQPNPKLSAWKVLLKTLWENGKAGLSTGRSWVNVFQVIWKYEWTLINHLFWDLEYDE